MLETEAVGGTEVADDEGWCDEAEVTLLAVEEVPLEGGLWAAAPGVSVPEEEVGALLTELLLDLRVEPTSLRKREFIDDIQRGAFLAAQAKRREGGEGAEPGAEGASRRSLGAATAGLRLIT